MNAAHRPPIDLGPMPAGTPMITTDELIVRAAPNTIFDIVRHVEQWPAHLAHYRFVRFHHTDGLGGGVVEMAAYRPFGPVNWPTWWLSEMQVLAERPAIRFRHIGGITTGMHVEWSFEPTDDGRTRVLLLHHWDGPRWPLIGTIAAVAVIGPVFVHGIASRTLAGLARVAEGTPR